MITHRVGSAIGKDRAIDQDVDAVNHGHSAAELHGGTSTRVSVVSASSVRVGGNRRTMAVHPVKVAPCIETPLLLSMYTAPAICISYARVSAA